MFINYCDNFNMFDMFFNMPNFSSGHEFSVFGMYMTTPALPPVQLPKIDNPLFNFAPTNCNFNVDIFNPSRKQPSFNYDLFSCNIQNTKTTTKTTATKPIDNNYDKDLFAGINTKVAEAMCKDIISHAEKTFNKNCSKYVSNMFSRLHLENHRPEHAYQRIEGLRNNTHFKEIPVDKIPDKYSLPRGAVLVYDKGVCGYDKESGHVEIAIGNGKATSESTQNIKWAPSAVFIPV